MAGKEREMSKVTGAKKTRVRGAGPPVLTPEVLGGGPDLSLSPADRKFLEEREGVIAKGLKNFIEVGRALMEIRDHQGGVLYKDQYGGFEDYCRIRWGIGRDYGYRLMDASTVVRQLKMSPIGDKLPEPTCEGQVRSLSLLANAGDMRKAWAEAVEKHGPSPMGREVDAIVRRMLRDGAKRRSKRSAETPKKKRAAGLRLDARALREIRAHLDAIGRGIPAEKAKAREALERLREIFGG